jgi:arginine repressor
LQKAGYIINPPFSMRQINHTKLKNLEEFILKKNYNSSKEFLEYLKGTGIYSNTQTKISLKQMRKALSIFIEEYEGELEYEITFQMLQKA